MRNEHGLDRGMRHGSQEKDSLIVIVLSPFNFQQSQQRKTYRVGFARPCVQNSFNDMPQKSVSRYLPGGPQITDSRFVKILCTALC